jgi:excisionase family DNA binding protein
MFDNGELMTNTSSLERWLTEHGELMRTREVAQVLGLSERTIRDMASRGELSVVRLGNSRGRAARLQFRVRDIATYISAHTTLGTGPNR